MKIGVISDIHISTVTSKLPEEVYEHFKDCDLIIHAGDAVESSVIKELEKIAKTKAVKGNMDSAELKKALPEKIVFKAEDKKIGVIHGRGAPSKVFQIVSDSFKEKLDIVIFGHSHIAFNEKKGNTLFFNPGSATDKIFSPYCSLGIIYIEDGEVRAEIIKIDE